MARVIVILASTFLGTLLGVLIGHLNMQSLIETATPGYRVRGDMFLVSYLVAPLLGTVVGFALSILALKMPDSRQP